MESRVSLSRGFAKSKKEEDEKRSCYRRCGCYSRIPGSFIPCFRWRGGRTWLRYSSLHLGLATCPNLIYPLRPNQWPITRWLQPADDRSFASSTRVNNTPERMLISILPRHHSSTTELWPRSEDRPRSHTWNHFRLVDPVAATRDSIVIWSSPFGHPFCTLWSSSSAAFCLRRSSNIEFLLLSFLRYMLAEDRCLWKNRG